MSSLFNHITSIRLYFENVFSASTSFRVLCYKNISILTLVNQSNPLHVTLCKFWKQLHVLRHNKLRIMVNVFSWFKSFNGSSSFSLYTFFDTRIHLEYSKCILHILYVRTRVTNLKNNFIFIDHSSFPIKHFINLCVELLSRVASHINNKAIIITLEMIQSIFCSSYFDECLNLLFKGFSNKWNGTDGGNELGTCHKSQINNPIVEPSRITCKAWDSTPITLWPLASLFFQKSLNSSRVLVLSFLTIRTVPRLIWSVSNTSTSIKRIYENTIL